MTSAITSLQIGMHWFPERPGGLDRMYQSLVESLPLAGVGVHGLVAGSSGVGAASSGAVEAFADAGQGLPARWMGMRTKTRELLKRSQLDLVASHFALYTFPVLDLIGWLPTVIHFHGPWADEGAAEGGHALSRMLKQRLEASVYRRGNLHIVLSRAFGSVLEQRYGMSGDTIRVVPGCVDIARFAVTASRSEARAAFGWPTDRPVVVAVRRLARRMGLENLVDAIVQVRKREPEILMVIVGKGAMHAALAARIKELGLERNVRLQGFVADEQLPLVYRAADFSIVPTLALEGFGLAAVESLAAGTPVLVTPVGGLPEAVEGLSPELVLPDSSAPALARGMIAALSGELRLPGDDECRRYARERFDLPVISKLVAGVYREALAK